MRHLTLALLAAGLAAPAALAQPKQPAAPAADPYAAHLDAVLGYWEKAMGGVNSFSATCTRTTVDRTFKTSEVFEGVAKYLRVNQTNYASLKLDKKNAPGVVEKYVCTGTHVYIYPPGQKVVRIHEMPKNPKGQVTDEGFLTFLFGMKASEAKQRYTLKYTPPAPTDKHYYYVDILPREPGDKRDFERARLVLSAQTYLPRQLWFVQPNGTEITFDFPQVQTGVNLAVTEFTQPEIPAGWQTERVPPPQPQARVIRPQQ
jgi:TIGR03009 family protein